MEGEESNVGPKVGAVIQCSSLTVCLADLMRQRTDPPSSTHCVLLQGLFYTPIVLEANNAVLL